MKPWCIFKEAIYYGWLGITDDKDKSKRHAPAVSRRPPAPDSLRAMGKVALSRQLRKKMHSCISAVICYGYF